MIRANHTVTALALILCLSACGEQPAPDADEPSAHEHAAAAVTPAVLTRTASPEGARVFFITPANGDTVSNPIRIEFGIEGMSVARAGEPVPNSGHHHLLIDTELPDLGAPIPADANHVHFGDGSTATEIALAPGQHMLRMLLADYRHVPHNPPVVSEPITVTVE